jgi:transposase
MTRKITEEMERLYRLVHHDFGGKSYVEAARVAGTSISSVYRVLGKMKRLAPQLFPILNQEQAKLWKAWKSEGLTCSEIAYHFHLTEDAVNSKLNTIRHKLGISEPHKRTTVRMPSSQMDELEPDKIVDTF